MALLHSATVRTLSLRLRFAIKRLLAHQLAEEMKQKKIAKIDMVIRMQTS
jgi:hypothetical protein